MANKPKMGHTGGPRPPGYVCPKRRDRTPFTIYIEHSLRAALLEIAHRKGKTLQDEGEELCRFYVANGGRLSDLSRK
jgi:hypothetical protein